MNKKWIYLIIILFSAMLMAGCKSEQNKSDYEKANEDIDYTAEPIKQSEPNLPNRKIIYKVEASLTTEDLNQTIKAIKAQMLADEWFESEEITNDSAELVIRIKTSNLETFLEALYDGNTISDFTKTATDVSLTYEDRSNRLLTLQTEYTRLLEIYEKASMSEMMTISRRLSEIDIEMNKINGELNQFDSLVEYSQVRLHIYTQTPEKEKQPHDFSEQLNNAFSGGFSTLVAFLSGLLIVVVALTPWLIVLVPIGYVVYRITKKHKKVVESPKDEPYNNSNQG